MENNVAPTTVVAVAFLVLFSALLHPAAAVMKPQLLQVGFYQTSCPNAENLVRQSINNYFDLNPAIAAGIIRIFLHDCFVRGCDASVLLDATSSGLPVEKNSPANGNTLKGLDAIDDAKLSVEAQCPGTVSCADILAFATRDAIEYSGLARFDVPAGRRDGTVSLASEVLRNIPFPFTTMSNMSDLFRIKGFTKEEMVILLGAHSIGGAQCNFITGRLYSNTTGMRSDLLIEPMYADLLKKVCPQGSSTTKVNFDPDSPFKLDASYYNLVATKRSLLASDQLLMTNKATRTVVRQLANNPQVWPDLFTKLIVKMGTMDVLGGTDGEVRTSCRYVNSNP